MGTKVQCESYYPGYSSMRDLNKEAGSSWSLYHEDKTSNNHHYNNRFSPRPTTDGYSVYVKLKQTMLQQEEIFRTQLYDLHLVYRRQMEWMDEVKRKERGKYLVPVEASQSSALSSQMHSEDAQRTWHIHSLPSVDSASSRASASVTDNMQSVLQFINVSGMQTSPVTMQNAGSFKECTLLEFKSKKLPRRKFDLQLPADEYIDSEEGEPIEKERDLDVSVVSDYPLKRNCGIAPERDVKLSLGGGVKPSFRVDASSSGLGLRNKQDLADLNEPIQVEEATASVPVNFLGPITCQREIQGQDLSAKPNSAFLGLPGEFVQNTQIGKCIGARVKIIHLENGENRRDWLSSHFDAGQCSTKLNYSPQGSEKLLTPSASIQAEFKKAHAPPEYGLDSHIKRELWSGSAISGTEISKRSQSLSNDNFSGPVVAPCTLSPYPVIPQYDVATDSGCQPVSSWMLRSSLSQKQTVQALSHSDTSAQLSYKTAIQNPGLIADRWHLNCYPKLKLSIRNEASYQNGLSHCSQSDPNASHIHFPSASFDFLKYSGGSTSASKCFANQFSTKYFKGSDCRDVKSAKDMNLNLAPPNMSPQDVVIIDGEEENEDPSGGLVSFRAVCNNGPPKENGCFNKRGFSFLQAYSQEVSHKTRKEEVPISGYTPDITSVSYSLVAEPERIEVGECLSSKKIIGFPIFDKPLSKDPSSVTFSKPLHDPSKLEEGQSSLKNQVFDINLSQDPEIPDSGQQCNEDLIIEKAQDNDISVSRKYINLNSPVDEEEEALITNSLPITVRITAEIDLEAPVVPETEESIPSALEPAENQVRPIYLSITQTQEAPDEFVRTAAEAIVLMSFSVICNRSDNVCRPPSEESQWDSLHWFAEVALSNKVDLDGEVALVLMGKGQGKNQESLSDEIDYFESMTLKITETKEDEYWCSKPLWRFEDPNEEEKCASLLLTRRQRGQARRGRQRRDFQRDILPGLASLSRHEVAEDLQTIGGLMRAMGCSWQTRVTRRNSARNGCARWSRLSAALSPTLMAVSISPPREQPNNNEQGLCERSLKGWGKTSRRPRRQKFAAGNAPIPLTQL